MLTGMGVAFAMVFVNLAMTHRMRLICVVLLMVFQLYVPGFPITLALLWTLLTCAAGLVMRGRTPANSPLVVSMGVCIAVTAVSLLWALPSGMETGAGAVIRGLVFLLWLREMIVVAKDDPRLLNTITVWAIPGIAVQALLTIVFRVSPATEEGFLRSQLAAPIMGPRWVEELYSDNTRNVLSLERAGGLFLNVNVASLFGGIAALLLLVAARRSARGGWLYFFSALSLAGALFAGSKTAIFVTAACVVAALCVPHAFRGKAALLAQNLIALLPFAFAAAWFLLPTLVPELYEASLRSFSRREELWDGAAQLFMESPILGLGYGGWSEQMRPFVENPNQPPHNFIIAAWAYSGVFSAAAAIIFMVVAVAFGVRVAAAQPTVYDRRTAVLALLVIIWTFIHGMADNTSVYGEQRTMILFGLAFGYLYAMSTNQKQASRDSSITGKRETFVAKRM